MEVSVAGDPNKIDFWLFWIQLTAAGPVAWLVAIGVMAVLLAAAWRMLNR
jgi:hypothetical protein